MPNKKLDLMAYGSIGGWPGVSAQEFARALSDSPDAEEVTVRVHSQGGDAMDGIAISNALRAHAGRVVCYVDGLAASAASMICMGADEVIMAENAVMMLHNPWTMAMGDGDELREQADAIDVLGKAYVAGYARKSGQSERAIRALMDKYSWRTGAWLSAKDAVKEGLADRVGPPMTAQARAGGMRAFAASPLSSLLAGLVPAELEPRALAAPRSTEMNSKDWAARLRAAESDEDRKAILAEMDQDNEEPKGTKKKSKAEDGDEDEDEKKKKKEDESKDAKASAVQAILEKRLQEEAGERAKLADKVAAMEKAETDKKIAAFKAEAKHYMDDKDATAWLADWGDPDKAMARMKAMLPRKGQLAQRLYQGGSPAGGSEDAQPGLPIETVNGVRVIGRGLSQLARTLLEKGEAKTLADAQILAARRAPHLY